MILDREPRLASHNHSAHPDATSTELTVPVTGHRSIRIMIRAFEYTRRRMPTFVLLSAAAAVWTGCVPGNAHLNRSNLSAQLLDRTGAGIRETGSAESGFPPNIEVTDGVSADEAVAIALWNNPTFQESLSSLGIERAKLAQAGQLTNPNFSILFPWGPKQLEYTASFPLEAFWLRSHRVALARFDAERVAHNLVQGGLNLVRDVRVGLADFALATTKTNLATAALLVQERLIGIAKARLAAGEATPLEVASSRAEFNKVLEESRRFRHEADLAYERLMSLLGLVGNSDRLNFQNLTQPMPLKASLEELERRALAARPDLRASELSLEAAAKLAGLAKFEWITLSGILDANKTPSGTDLGPGASFSIPLFHQNQSGRIRAKAEIERSAWNLIGARQRVVLEVRQAYARYNYSLDALGRWQRDVVAALEQLVRGSEKAYELGELSPQVVQDNVRQLLVARAREAELQAEIDHAFAELQRAVGARLEPN